jgi:hypothetical protein
MTQQQTYDILKYGYMNPQKVRDIITDHFESSTEHYYSDWEEYNNVDTSDGQLTNTHFIKIWVYYDDIDNRLVLALFVRDEEYLNEVKNRYITINNCVVIDCTHLTSQQVLVEFQELFKDVHRICQYKEWNDNYPNGSFEH